MKQRVVESATNHHLSVSLRIILAITLLLLLLIYGVAVLSFSIVDRIDSVRRNPTCFRSSPSLELPNPVPESLKGLASLSGWFLR